MTMLRIALAAALAGCLLLACQSDAADSPPATATIASEDPEEAAHISETLSRVADRVEKLRGLDGGDGPTTTLLTEEDLAALIDELLPEPESAAALEHDQALYTLLGLIDPDTDLTAVTREVAIAGIAGLYRPEIDHLYVRMFGSFSALEEATASHEYQHYLQDRHYDLDALLDGASRDTVLAVRALVEGEASFVENQYVAAYFNAAQTFGLGFGGALAAVDAPAVPPVLARETQFVYLDGLDFITRLVDGGLTQNDLFDRPPATTEQILHPEKYRSSEPAIDVAPTLERVSLPAGWTVLASDTLGEFMLDTWLREWGAASDATVAAAGWGGDAYQLLETPEGRPALRVLVAWDSPDDQREFFEIATTVLGESAASTDCRACDFPLFGGDGRVTAIHEAASSEDGWTLLVVAPSAEEAAALIALAR